MLSTSWLFFSYTLVKMINMGMGGVPFDPPFTPWWDRLMNSQEQAVGFVKWHTQQWNMSSSYEYFHGLLLFGSQYSMYIRRYFSTNFNISRRSIMFPWFMRARLHKLLIENSIHKQSSRNVTNYQKTTSIILIQLLGAIHIMGCEHTWLPLIYITTTNLAYMLSRFRR